MKLYLTTPDKNEVHTLVTSEETPNTCEDVNLWECVNIEGNRIFLISNSGELKFDADPTQFEVGKKYEIEIGRCADPVQTQCGTVYM